MRLLQASLVAVTTALLPITAGCTTGKSSSGANDPCADINVAVGETSKELSAAAISRGKISNFNVPFWLPGGKKAVTALKDRQTRKIEGLETELAEKRQQRSTECVRPG